MRYFYQITALDGSSHQSVPSAISYATNSPNAPFNLTVSSISTNTLVLNWRDVSGDTGYRIERSTDGVNFSTLATVPANYPSYTDNSATVGTQYWYRLVAQSPTGESAYSNVYSQWTRPAAVSPAFTTVASNQIALSWTGVSGAANYMVERSTDGSTYTSLATSSATSYTDNTVAPLGTYYYRVTALNSINGGGASTVIFTATPATTPLPYQWQAQDIGLTTSVGATGYNGTTGAYTVISTGSDIYGTSDQLRFSYLSLTGDGSIVAKVNQQNTGNVKSGVMIRQSLSASAAEVSTLIGGTSSYNEVRATNGAATSYSAGATGQSWVKLTRAGNVFTSQVSVDGITWTTIATNTITMTGTVYIGLASDSGSAALLNTTTFSNMVVNVAGASAPTVATAAAMGSVSSSTNSASLSVLGADSTGESNLYYSWAVTSVPAGVATPTFSANGTNAAKNSMIRFFANGNYQLTATITDTYGLTVTSVINVTVSAVTAPTWIGAGANNNWSNPANWANAPWCRRRAIPCSSPVQPKPLLIMIWPQERSSPPSASKATISPSAAMRSRCRLPAVRRSPTTALAMPSRCRCNSAAHPPSR